MTSNVLTATEFIQFEALVVEAGRHTEVECEAYLAKAAGLLLLGSPSNVNAIQQDRNFFGSSDLTVTASILNETMQVADYAFIWELKAPQCYLMEFDENKNRCRPTPDLIKAENQLIHYCHEAQNSDAYRARLKILHRDKIRPGGIIIGTKDRMLRGAKDSGEVERAVNSLSIREKYFYQPNGIRILTWDRILEFLRP